MRPPEAGPGPADCADDPEPSVTWIEASGVGQDLTNVFERGTPADPVEVSLDHGALRFCGTATYAARLVVAGAVHIEGAGAENTRLDAHLSGSVVAVREGATVEASGMWLYGGRAESGGGLLCDGCERLVLADVWVTDSEAVVGGGVSATASRVSLSNVRVQANVATSTGGGWQLTADSVTVEGGYLAGNLSRDTSGGGAVRTTGNLSVRGLGVVGNQAATGVGGVRFEVDGGRAQLVELEVRDNMTLAGPGGGVGLRVSSGGGVTVSGGVFSGNSADFGGGLSARGSEVSLELARTRFEDNVAVVGGGAVGLDAVFTGVLELADVDFVGNRPSAVARGDETLDAGEGTTGTYRWE